MKQSGPTPTPSSQEDPRSLARFREAVATEVDRIGCELFELDEILHGIPYRHALSSYARSAPPRWIEVQILETLRNEPSRQVLKPRAGR